MMHRCAAALALVVGAVSMVGIESANAGTITQTRAYTGTLVPNRSVFYLSCNQAPSLGGVCFEPPPGATEVTFTVVDRTTLTPGALVRFLSAGGSPLAVYEQCAPTSYPVPAATNRVQVMVNGIGELQSCPEAATGTVGDVTATWTVEHTPPPPDENGYVPSQPVFEVVAERDHYVPSGDASVEADVYRPNVPGTFPAIVWFDVYWKDDPGAIVNSERDFFVSRGFVFVHASSPGSNTSGGRYENAFGPDEQQAAYDVVEWAATQPWSNGLVGMQGLSYAAIIEYFVAAMRPPSLVTIYPTSAYSDLYREIVYTGGNLQAGYPILWDLNNRTTTFTPPTSVSNDPATQFSNYATSVSGYRPIVADFLRHPTADEFYAVRSPATRNASIEVPAAIDVGWGDDMVYGGPINFETVGSEHKRLIIGPWGHSGAHRRPDGREERLRWFDFWLKGKPSGVNTDPRARIFIHHGGATTDGSWVSSNTWPLAGTNNVAFHVNGQGSLGTAAPASDGSVSYDYSPTSHLEDGDSVSFVTDPLPQPLTVVGYPELVLSASTTARDTSFTVTLYDVAPDGSRERLQRGWLRARAREVDDARSQVGRPFHTFDGDDEVPAGEVVEYRIAIWPFANTFPTGHRIQLELSDLPVGPGGAPILAPLDPATNMVRWGPTAGTTLWLPVVG